MDDIIYSDVQVVKMAINTETISNLFNQSINQSKYIAPLQDPYSKALPN